MNKPNQISDAWLVQQYQAGHKNALALLVQRWHVKFCKQAYYYTKDADIAKDIAQDSWSVILKKVKELNDTNKFGPWALAIVTRKAIDWLRKQKRERIKLDDYLYQVRLTDKKDAVLDDTILLKAVMEGIKELSEGHQIVLKLFYLENYTLLEISKVLQLSKGTIKSRLFYARENLKTILKAHNEHKL